MSGKCLKGRLRLGYIVFGALVVAKIGEYLIVTQIGGGDWPYLAVLAVAGAGLIMYYFMHIRHLWRPGDKDNE